MRSTRSDLGADSTSVVARALAVLSTFSRARPAHTLSSIARDAGLPLTTAHRIVGELAVGGVLERGADGRYRIGVRLWEIASLAPRSAGLQAVARPYMQDLFETTHYATHLAIREGHEAVFIERLRLGGASNPRPYVGGRYPLHSTGAGLVLLAHAPESVIDKVLAEPLRPYTANTITDAEDLKGQLSDVRRNGFVVSDRQMTRDDVAIAAPVVSRDGAVVAALSLIVPHEHRRDVNAAHLVRSTARMISRAIGEHRAAAKRIQRPSE